MLTEREERIVQQLAEKCRLWLFEKYCCSRYDDSDIGYAGGYNSAKQGCVADLDDMMDREFGDVWKKAVVATSRRLRGKK